MTLPRTRRLGALALALFLAAPAAARLAAAESSETADPGSPLGPPVREDGGAATFSAPLGLRLSELLDASVAELQAEDSSGAGEIGGGGPPPPEPPSSGSAPPPDSPWSLRGGLGFTLDPGTCLLAFEAAYNVLEPLRVGPLLQLGVSDNRVILAPSLNVEYAFDLAPLEADLAKLRPFVQGGAGFAYFHKDHRRGDNDDVGFLLNFGFGFEYYLTEGFALGSNMLFNFLPADALGDHFFFSWQFVTATFRF
jgi:hypothetical protein